MRLKLEKPLSFNPRAYAFSKPGKAKAAGSWSIILLVTSGSLEFDDPGHGQSGLWP
jgi:hypothetical protein